MKSALFSWLAAGFAIGALAGVAVGQLGAKTGWLSPYVSFRLSNALGARRFGCHGVLLTTVSLLRLLVFNSAPPIHDLSTDLEHAPEFHLAAGDSSAARRHRPYPHGGAEVPNRQREAYPDLAPIRVRMTPAEAFEKALATARQLGWNITWSDPEQGKIEATETSRWFRFVDDIALRVRPSDQGSVVDLRSISRVGVSDLGANAARIRRFEGRFQVQ